MHDFWLMLCATCGDIRVLDGKRIRLCSCRRSMGTVLKTISGPGSPFAMGEQCSVVRMNSSGKVLEHAEVLKVSVPLDEESNEWPNS